MSATPVVVRPGVAEDAGFIRELSRTAFTEYSRTAGRDAARSGLRDRTLVATRVGRAIGFVVLQEPDRGRAYIAAIAVVEEARGRGVGRELLHAAERLARGLGARELALTTAESNLAALELFQRSGFARVARHRGFYPRGQDAVELKKAV